MNILFLSAGDGKISLRKIIWQGRKGLRGAISKTCHSHIRVSEPGHPSWVLPMQSLNPYLHPPLPCKALNVALIQSPNLSSCFRSLHPDSTLQLPEWFTQKAAPIRSFHWSSSFCLRTKSKLAVNSLIAPAGILYKSSECDSKQKYPQVSLHRITWPRILGVSYSCPLPRHLTFVLRESEGY